MTRTPRTLGLLLALTALAPDAPPRVAAVGESFRVPYRVTQTNHYLVRVRIDGKGPFNFLVDSGAPALYVGTEAAKAVGLEPDKKEFWTEVDRLDIEGGATLTGLKARVEDPFQLTGMNAMGLPGARIDGILGFTILAKFRLEIDPTKDRMVWTRIDYDPKEPFVPERPEDRVPPAGVQLMQLTGGFMKLAALGLGKQPDDQFLAQGLLGLGLAEEDGAVKVTSVLPSTPAAEAGVRVGDVVTNLRNREIKTLESAHESIAESRVGDQVRLTVRRGDESKTFTLTASEGL